MSVAVHPPAVSTKTETETVEDKGAPSVYVLVAPVCTEDPPTINV